MTDDLDVLNDEADAPETPLEPAPPITDRFLFVDVASLRAKQLRRGAVPRLGTDAEAREDAPAKPERIAMEEVRRGLVPYEVPPHKPRLPAGQV